MRKKNKYALPYWRIRLLNFLNKKHKGCINYDVLFKKHVKEKRERYVPLYDLVYKIIDTENGGSYNHKKKVFLVKSNLSGTFLRDMPKPKYKPRMMTILAIIMGHNVDEISDVTAQTLTHAAGLSLENSNPVHNVYTLLLNLRSMGEIEKKATHLTAYDMNKRRITAANEILYEIYIENKSFFDKALKITDKKRIPREFVLGRYDEA